MMADVLDEYEATTGRRPEGTVFGLHSLLIQLGASVAVVVSGVLIDRYAGLVPGSSVQSLETARKIGVVYGLVPSGILALAGTISLFYTLDRRRVRDFQQTIERSSKAADVGASATAL
jgi:Na+/melibiose symporter-like transporter